MMLSRLQLSYLAKHLIGSGTSDSDVCWCACASSRHRDHMARSCPVAMSSGLDLDGYDGKIGKSDTVDPADSTVDPNHDCIDLGS